MIKIDNLSVAFDGPEVVKNVSFTIGDGEILGVVGESGSGKSVTALTLMGLVSESARVTSGEIYYDDQLLLKAGEPRNNALYRQYQGLKMSMVFQEPMTSLNPTMKVGTQVEEVLLLHDKQESGAQSKTKDAAPAKAKASGTNHAEPKKEENKNALIAWHEKRVQEKLDRTKRVLEALLSVGLKDVERV